MHANALSTIFGGQGVSASSKIIDELGVDEPKTNQKLGEVYKHTEFKGPDIKHRHYTKIPKVMSSATPAQENKVHTHTKKHLP